MMKIPRPAAPYFLVRVSRQEIKDRKEKIGSIHLAQTQVFMERNVQWGQIIGIGEKAHKMLPEARIGDTLIFHHFVVALSDHNAKESHLIEQDETYNYYVVTADEVPGKRLETYGVWNGTEIIPHPGYVFLEKEKEITAETHIDEIHKRMNVSSGGILMFDEWKESREKTEEKMDLKKKEVFDLSKSGTEKDHIKQGIAEKEAELQEMSKKINRTYFEAYKVEAFNKQLHEWFGGAIKKGSTMFTLYQASQTTIEFQNKEYRVVPVDIQYIGGILSN